MSKIQLYEIELYGVPCKLTDARREKSIKDNRRCYKLHLPWKSLYCEPINLMDYFAIPDEYTGELLLTRVIELSNQGWGDNSYIIVIEVSPPKDSHQKSIATI